MNVQEALEKLLEQEVYNSEGYYDDALLLAPIIERALRAAYNEGWHGCNKLSPHVTERGVTAGVAAMMEEEECTR